MHPDTAQVAAHMREFGLHALGRAVYDATFSEFLRPFTHAISVTLAALAGEILIKARIAEEHPLLIFQNLPKSTNSADLLDIQQLLEQGKTVGYADLPELLWATTGYQMAEATRFLEFGKLRNAIAHFAVPDSRVEDETIKYAFEVLDPILGDLWNETLIPYAVVWDEEIVAGLYLNECLEELSIRPSNPLSLAALAESQ